MADPLGIDIDWREPWAPAGKFAVNLEDELRRELGSKHPLHGLPAVAFARRTDADDVLFALSGSEAPLAVVHLTWSGGNEPDGRWPTFILFKDQADWIERGMIPDHEEFSAR